VSSPRRVAVVTGGAGFIGSHLVDKLLDQDYRVRVIDNLVGGRIGNIAHHANNSNFDFIEDSILNLDSNSRIFLNVDEVFHLAGLGDIVPSIENPVDYMETNVLGTIRVAEASRYAKISKLVYAASSSCYGLADVPTSESAPTAPQYPYALSKFQGEQALFHWNNVYKLPVVSIRIFNAYGPRSRTSGSYGAVFGIFLKQMLEGKPFTLVGDGEQSRDFVFATDVANAFYLAGIKGKSGEIYNLGSGNPRKIIDIVKILGGEISFLKERPGEPNSTWANISKIQNELGWEPTVTLEQGISKMLEDIGYWKDAPLWESESIALATKAWFEFLGGPK
jgi:UDP-glucose 4-epimerase